MKIKCVWEHNGNDSLIYVENFTGAFTRGPRKEIALSKMQNEIDRYLKWVGEPTGETQIEIVQEKQSDLAICDADSDVLFDSEMGALTKEKYERLKALALKSAEDFFSLYNSIPDKDLGGVGYKKTFYGKVPSTANEIYSHTKGVNSYYFAEIGIEADFDGDICEIRKKGFALLEEMPDFLSGKVFDGSYGEKWTVKKVLRRFIWHDRIHAKALYRMARRLFGEDKISNPFFF